MCNPWTLTAAVVEGKKFYTEAIPIPIPIMTTMNPVQVIIVIPRWTLGKL